METDPVASLVRVLFLPLSAFALALSVAWRLVGSRRVRTTLQLVCSISFFAPQVAVILLWNESIHLVLHQEAVVALWLVASATAVAWRAVLRTRQEPGPAPGHRRRPGPTLVTVRVLGLSLFALLQSKDFVKDALARRTVVDGSIERLWITRGPRRIAVHRYASVDGHTIQLTADVFRGLHLGDRIHGEVGAGSGTLLNVER